MLRSSNDMCPLCGEKMHIALNTGFPNHKVCPTPISNCSSLMLENIGYNAHYAETHVGNVIFHGDYAFSFNEVDPKFTFWHFEPQPIKWTSIDLNIELNDWSDIVKNIERIKKLIPFS